MVTKTTEGWPLAKRGEEIVWRGIIWVIEDIIDDRLIIKAKALTARRKKKLEVEHEDC